MFSYFFDNIFFHFFFDIDFFFGVEIYFFLNTFLDPKFRARSNGGVFRAIPALLHSVWSHLFQPREKTVWEMPPCIDTEDWWSWLSGTPDGPNPWLTMTRNECLETPKMIFWKNCLPAHWFSSS